jgi:hypothetical protein
MGRYSIALGKVQSREPVKERICSICGHNAAETDHPEELCIHLWRNSEWLKKMMDVA